MKNQTYRVIIRKEPEGNYTAFVPSLPGCITWGDSIEETLELAKDAIEGCLEIMKEEGIEIIDDSNTFEYSLQIENIAA